MSKYIIEVEEIIDDVYVSTYEVEAENKEEAQLKFLDDRYQCKFIDTFLSDQYIACETIINTEEK